MTRIVLFADVLASRAGTCATCRRPVQMLLVALGKPDYLTGRQLRDWVACDQDQSRVDGLPRHVCVPRVTAR